MSNNKIYILKEDSGLHPYEIMIYDPRSEEDPPDWFTDILKFDKLDENGNPIYQKSVGESGDITYQVPSINGHINIPTNCIVARDTYSNEIFPMKKDLFESMYKIKNSSFIEKVLKFIKQKIR